MDKKKAWTDSLPELLDGYTETAPEGLWDAVQAGLQPQKRRIVPLWWAAGTLAAAAAVVLAVILWPESRIPQQTSLPVDSGESLLAETVIPVPVSTPAPTPTPSVKPVKTHSNAPVVTETETVTSGSDTPVMAETENVMAGPDTPVMAGSDTPVMAGSDRPSPPVTTIPLQEQIKKKYRGNVQLALLSGGSLSPGVTLEKNGFGLPSQPGVFTRAADGGLTSTDVTIFMVSRNKTSTLEAEHSQLTRFQFSVHYRFQPRWGTESGLVLSRLQSRFESTVGQNRSVTTRQVRYLGIPLYLHFQAPEWGRLSLYMQAGPMYEITLDTPSTTTTYMAGTEISSRTDNTYIRDDIWSLNVNAGLQLRLFRHGAVFVQPGFSWHLAGENNLETFYTAHPAAFSLSLGYRVLLF
jgi:hypothetical protein